jgi:hypothetical protein
MGSQALVFDGLTKPTGIIALPQMVGPGGVVNTLGQLHKQHEILRAQVELTLRTTEVKALILSQLALRILTPVAEVVSATRRHAELLHILF